MAWNRKKIITFCNEQIFPYVKTWTGCKGELFDVVKTVEKFRRENGYPKEMTAKVVDGFLYINGLKAGRIAPKTPKIPWSIEQEYWEGLSMLLPIGE